MLYLNLSLGQSRAFKNELSEHASKEFRDMDAEEGFNTHEEMKEHIQNLHSAIDSVPDWRRNAEEKEAWHASLDNTMVNGVGFPTGEDLPGMKASEYMEHED